MDITPAGLCIAVLFGAIGTGLFLYGRKQRRPPQLLAGIALMLFPGLVQETLWMTVVGVAILGLLVLSLRMAR